MDQTLEEGSELATDRLIETVAGTEHRDLSRRDGTVSTQAKQWIARRRPHEDKQQRERHQEGDRRLERPAEHPTAHLNGSGWGMPGRPTTREAAARTTPG
jgi:hypothetical protein